MQNKRIFAFIMIIFAFEIFSTELYCQIWERIEPTFEPPGIYDLELAKFVDENTGWFAEFYPARIWKTSDSGKKWFLQRDSTFSWIHSIDFIDTLVGFVVLENISTRERYLLKSIDGGKTWTQIKKVDFLKVIFFDRDTGLGYGNKIFKTNDGGLNWEEKNISYGTYNMGNVSPLFIDWLKDSHTLIASAKRLDLSHGGSILRSEDLGDTWRVIVPEIAELFKLDFDFNSSGYGVGYDNFGISYVYSTKDGGYTWEEKYTSNNLLNDVKILDEATWVIGNDGVILNSTNGFKTINYYDTITSENLKYIQFINSEKGFILGDNNKILIYNVNNTSVNTNYNNIFSDYFVLEPNYPNPFNSGTNINITLLRDDHLSIIIFDINGNEIKNLFSGFIYRGSYQFYWNALNQKKQIVSSGLYVINVIFGKDSQNQSILLLK